MDILRLLAYFLDGFSPVRVGRFQLEAFHAVCPPALWAVGIVIDQMVLIHMFQGSQGLVPAEGEHGLAVRAAQLHRELLSDAN
jgi:hypothetical protein